MTLKDGKLVAIQTLLKSLPASKGMPRTRLFQVVDIVPTQKCVLVTFQKADKQLVEDRQFDLEAELSDQLASGQASKLFTDVTQGLRFGHAYHKQRGKVIKIHNPSQTHLDFIQHADRLLASPPKKRKNTNMLPPEQTKVNPVTVTGGILSYSGVLQAQTTHTRSVADPSGVTTTTTTQASQTVMAVMETRFLNIEIEQQSMKQRLSHVENRTVTTDENIRAMMAPWKITPANIKRKFIDDNEDEENESYVENANVLTGTEQGQEATRF